MRCGPVLCILTVSRTRFVKTRIKDGSRFLSTAFVFILSLEATVLLPEMCKIFEVLSFHCAVLFL